MTRALPRPLARLAGTLLALAPAGLLPAAPLTLVDLFGRKIEAEVLRLEGDQLTLRRLPDRTEFTIELPSLSEDSQAAARAAAAALPPPTANRAAAAENPAPAPATVEHDTPPILTVRTPPGYPVSLRKKGISGEVALSFIIPASGIPEEIQVIRSTHPEFAKAAVASVKNWRFRPAMKNGKAVASRVSQLVQFNPPPSSEPPPEKLTFEDT